MKLPPLNALRAFEAVARLGSIRGASRELRISPSAISTHIKNLEYDIGLPLVQRKANALVLTKDGARYATNIRSGLQEISRATEEITDSPKNNSLRITCVPSLATTWMPEVFAKFRETHLSVSVECDFSPLLRQLYEDGFDLAVRYGRGDYPDDHSEPLFTDRIAPVCSPETQPCVVTPADLAKLDRIECAEGVKSSKSQWQYWCSRALADTEMSEFPGQSVTLVNSSTFAVEALLNSRTIAILDYSSVRNELAEGKLVCPLGGWVEAQNSYFVAYPKGRPLSNAAKQFKAVLKKHLRTSVGTPE